jgi:phage terminase large subunit GpA-like protein
MALADGGAVFEKGFFDGLRPDPVLTVSEWADRHRYLSQRASAEPGRFQTSRTPYLREIMDKLSSNDPTQRVVFMKGAQVGGTEAGNCWLAYSIDCSPAPFLAVSPTLEMAKRNSRTRIDPMIEECPRLREKVRDPKARDSGNSMLQKLYPGGVLVLAGANSASGLRSMPAKMLFADELDAWPENLDGEGSALDLAEARTRTFTRRKILIVSTPTLAGRSAIEREFLAGSMNFFHVPCVHCGAFQKLVWSGIKWSDDDPATARYVCEHCGGILEEHHKTKMLAEGQWISENPEGNGTESYHISTLYSPLGWFSWADCVASYLKAQKSENALKVWTNTILGETWAEKGEAPDWQDLYNRRDSYPIGQVPEKACVLTMGVDVQQDYLAFEVVGWGPGLESWSIDWGNIPGDTASDEVWQELTRKIATTYPTADGFRMGIRMCAVDTGYRTQDVYRWVKSQPPTRVLAIKGRDNQAVIVGQPTSAEIGQKGRKIKTGLKVWPIGVSVAKSELYGWLRRKARADEDELPHGWLHFPEYDEEFFKQLTAETLTQKTVRGYPRYVWEKTRDRNEALDTRVYARACAQMLGCDRFDPARWKTERQNGLTSEGGARLAPETREIKRRASSFL